MSSIRTIKKEELPLLGKIDRKESIAQFYRIENGRLTLYDEALEVAGWEPDEIAHNAAAEVACFERGGWFRVVFDEQLPVAVVVLDSVFVDIGMPALQLKFLHVSHAYRGRGLAGKLFRLAGEQARTMGAAALYISATPTRNTVDFYLRLGCRLLERPDPELYRLEPEDIHLYFPLSG